MLGVRPSRSARSATAVDLVAHVACTSSADCVVTRNSRGSAPFSTFAHHDV